MKKNYLPLITGLFLIVLTGCGGQPIMPAIEYNKPIDFHTERTAVLYWEIGKQNTSTLTTMNNSLVGNVIESIDRKNNPSKYILTYGKAEQAIFITSFKNILEKQSVFKNVEIITDPKQANTKDVFITINFRSTRVSSPELGYQISLSVDMSIKSLGKPTFTRTFFVRTDDDGFDNFKNRQNKVSIKLAENLMAGLKQWHEGKS